MTVPSDAYLTCDLCDQREAPPFASGDEHAGCGGTYLEPVPDAIAISIGAVELEADAPGDCERSGCTYPRGHTVHSPEAIDLPPKSLTIAASSPAYETVKEWQDASTPSVYKVPFTIEQAQSLRDATIVPLAGLLAWLNDLQWFDGHRFGWNDDHQVTPCIGCGAAYIDDDDPPDGEGNANEPCPHYAMPAELAALVEADE